MCFSATASFTAGTALVVLGTLAVRQVRRRSELPFALIPALFGIQQLIEGALWMTFFKPQRRTQSLADAHLLILFARPMAILRAFGGSPSRACSMAPESTAGHNHSWCRRVAVLALLPGNGANRLESRRTSHRLYFSPFLYWRGLGALCIGDVRQFPYFKLSGGPVVWRCNVNLSCPRGRHLLRLVHLGVVLLRSCHQCLCPAPLLSKAIRRR